MCVIITTAAPIKAQCTQDLCIHSVLIYMSDFIGTMVVHHGLCVLIDMH